MDIKTKIFTKQHLEIYKKFHDIFKNKVVSSKGNVFIDFFGKNKDNYLNFIENSNSNYSVQISNLEINLDDYQTVLEQFLYPIFVGKIANSVNILESLSNQFKDLIKEFEDQNELKYYLSKHITDYFNIDVKIWAVDYDIEKTTGKIINVKATNNKTYHVKDIINNFFTITKKGEYVTDDALFTSNIIKKEQYLTKFAEKRSIFRKLIIENSKDPSIDPLMGDYFPPIAIFSITSSVNFDFVDPKTGEKIWNKISEDISKFEALKSYDFYMLGIEPITIDATLALNKLFN